MHLGTANRMDSGGARWAVPNLEEGAARSCSKDNAGLSAAETSVTLLSEMRPRPQEVQHVVSK